MSTSAELKVTTRGDREIVMTRDFNAPRHLVFDAFTKPELIRRWLLGPDGWSMLVCEVDLRVGGKYRYVWRKDSDGQELGLSGVFRDIDKPKRIVNTEQFDGAPGEAIDTTEFIEKAGRTTVTQVVLSPSKEARDGMLKSGMETGVRRSYERLDVVLTSTITPGASNSATTEVRQ